MRMDHGGGCRSIETKKKRTWADYKNRPKGFRRQFFDGVSGHVPASGVSGLKNLLADFAQKISEHGVRPAMSASAIVLPPVVRSAHPGGLKRSVRFITW